MNQFHYTENIFLDMWGGDCISIHVGENITELCDHFCDHYQLPTNYRIISPSVQASFIWVEEKQHQSYNLFIKLKTVSDRIIVHEVFHCTHRILQNKGMKLNDDTEEAYAYFLDYLFGKVTEVVKRAKIEYKNETKRSKDKDPAADTN